jgi:hypothetical protein
MFTCAFQNGKSRAQSLRNGHLAEAGPSSQRLGCSERFVFLNNRY